MILARQEVRVRLRVDGGHDHLPVLVDVKGTTRITRRLHLHAVDHLDEFGVLAGTENADLLYMAERLEVEGDLGQAGRLRKYFR